MEKYSTPKKVLIAPLDWGLGHASRCIPLISYLHKSGFEVIISSDGEQLSLLKKEFPGLRCIQLKGYNISYSRHKRWLAPKILWQTPKIICAIYREYNWLRRIIREEKVDIVISDNRYGLFSKHTYCIFITHQLTVKAPGVLLEQLIQRIMYRYINRFRECWVPDFSDAVNIAGALSHPQRFPIVPVKYIGPLTRFFKNTVFAISYQYLVILSGPEPQRSILENKILQVIPALKGKVMIIRGKPGSTEVLSVPANCTIENHLSTIDLQHIFNSSEYIISRSGYTTVMEVLSLQKKAILIPTPGQTEQEYLAKHLMKQRWCYCCGQEDDLLTHIQRAADFEYQFPKLGAASFKSAIDDLLQIQL